MPEQQDHDQRLKVLHAEALKRIALSKENDFRRYLLAECVEAYGELDDKQRRRLQNLLDTEQYQDARPLMITTYERGKAEGKAEGNRETALLQLETKFGTLAPEVRKRIDSLTPEQLRELLVDLLNATSLEQLHLGN